MKVIVLVTINSEAISHLTTEADITDIISTPIAKEIGYLLGDRSPYHSHPIAEYTIENDGEQIMFTMDTDYFNHSYNYEAKEDFEIFFETAKCRHYRGSWASTVAETTAAYDMGDDLRDAINQRTLLDKYLNGYETEWDLDMHDPEPEDDTLVYDCRVTIS